MRPMRKLETLGGGREARVYAAERIKELSAQGYRAEWFQRPDRAYEIEIWSNAELVTDLPK
jgi:hypothetical protein